MELGKVKIYVIKKPIKTKDIRFKEFIKKISIRIEIK